MGLSIICNIARVKTTKNNILLKEVWKFEVERLNIKSYIKQKLMLRELKSGSRANKLPPKNYRPTNCS